MRLVRRIFLTVTALALILGTGVALVLPGPQHMICPSCHDLEQIAPAVFVERAIGPAKRRRILANLEVANRRVARFFGPLEAAPRIVVCRTGHCAAQFGGRGAKGVAYGWFAILLVESRIFSVIAAHELVHTELHWRSGALGWLRGHVPAWFDEGLATVISKDPRFQQDTADHAVRDIMKVNSFSSEWGEHVRKVGWRTAYGAASTRVRQLKRRLGREKFKRFVQEVVREGLHIPSGHGPH